MKAGEVIIGGDFAFGKYENQFNDMIKKIKDNNLSLLIKRNIKDYPRSGLKADYWYVAKLYSDNVLIKEFISAIYFYEDDKCFSIIDPVKKYLEKSFTRY